MSGSGLTSQGTRGTTRPRAICPGCGRSIAVTFNSITGAAYLRSHVTSPGKRCVASGGTVSRDTLHEKGEPR